MSCDGHPLVSCSCDSIPGFAGDPPDVTQYQPTEKKLNSVEATAWTMPAGAACPISVTRTIRNDRYLDGGGAPQDLVNAGTLSATTTVYIRLYNTAGLSLGLRVNGRAAGSVPGAGCGWSTVTMEIPTSLLLFPAQRSTSQSNLFELYSTSNTLTKEQWIGFAWVSIKFKAQAPIVLVHGINDNNANAWQYWAPTLPTLGYTVNTEVDLPCTGTCNNAGAYNDSVTANRAKLSSQLPALARSYGTADLHLVGHSMGGINLGNWLVIDYPDREGTVFPKMRVISFTTLATPHKGSVMAAAIEPYKGLRAQAATGMGSVFKEDRISFRVGSAGWDAVNAFYEFAGRDSILSSLGWLWGSGSGPRAPGFPDLYPTSAAVATQACLILDVPFWAVGFDADYDGYACHVSRTFGLYSCISSEEEEDFYAGTGFSGWAASQMGGSSTGYELLAKVKDVSYSPWIYDGETPPADTVYELFHADVQLTPTASFQSNDLCVTADSALHPNAQTVFYQGAAAKTCTHKKKDGAMYFWSQAHLGANHISALRSKKPCVLIDSVNRIDAAYPM